MSLASMLYSPNGNNDRYSRFRSSNDVCRQIRGQFETRDRCVPVSSNQAFQEQECMVFFVFAALGGFFQFSKRRTSLKADVS